MLIHLDMNDTMTLADLLRTIAGSNLSRQDLKVQRARLRRRGLTNLQGSRRNSPYAVAPHLDVVSDRRAQPGVDIVADLALALA